MESKKQLVVWVKEKFPSLYQEALRKVNRRKRKSGGMGGIGDFFGDMFSSIKDLAPTVLQLKQQKALMKMQLKRAQQGLPPANVKDYTPVLRTQIDVGKDTRKAIGNEMSKYIIPAGIGLGALVLLLALKRGR